MNTIPRALRDQPWKRFLRAPDAQLLTDLYIPALGAATRYDRCCAYFSSHVLAVAARGFGRLIENLRALGDSAPKPAVRLIVNEQLDPEDLDALLASGDDAALADKLLSQLKKPKDALEQNRLAMLAWLVAQGLLEVRVGLMRHTQGIVHAKFGIVRDANGDALAFNGSDNETGQAILANYEELELNTSWQDAAFVEYYSERFEELWEDRDAQVTTVSLPEAVRLELLKLAPQQPPIEIFPDRGQAEASMVWRFLAAAPFLSTGADALDATAFVDLWPHQHRVVADTAKAYPAGRLLCDEVGMGKTIEAILILRRLLAGRGVQRALLLVPAGLLQQWQDELREKGGLLVPYWDKGYLYAPNGGKEAVAAQAALAEEGVLLLSREWARLVGNREVVLSSESWDLVLLDEAHAARRSSQVEREFNSANLLLQLIRDLQLRRKARSILLLSATPMQTQPWEPWDLLTTLGVGDPWMADFADIRTYYDGIAQLREGQLEHEVARTIGLLVAHDGEYPAGPSGLHASSPQSVANGLLFCGLGEPQHERALWLRKGAPLGRRMHRNTRDTLRQYHKMGLLDSPPAKRSVKDIVYDFQSKAERGVYDAITTYIDRRYDELEKEKAGKGFVMTVYRRRASSSPRALRRSLEHRLERLERVIRKQWAEDWFFYSDEQLDLRDLIDADLEEKIDPAVPSDPAVAAAEKQEVNALISRLDELGQQDSKVTEFWGVLNEVTSDGRSVLVFTEYTDTLEYLRDLLRPTYGKTLGCYSGDGGQVWDGQAWKTVSKADITARLSGGELRVLVCTDAASEGLNLQAAGALVNYDLPWNPSKVEQRIGRIDRIGQKHPVLHVRNLFLRDSVDMRVYELLRHRCGLFTHFVGRMQPVLAKARIALKNNPKAAEAEGVLKELKRTADVADDDAAVASVFVDSEAVPESPAIGAVTRNDLRWALTLLEDRPGGVRLSYRRETDTWRTYGLGQAFMYVSVAREPLERDSRLLPVTLGSDLVSLIADKLQVGAHVPLLLAESASGPYRAVEARWVAGGKATAVESIAQLRALLDAWDDGVAPDPGALVKADKEARTAAKKRVQEMEERARVAEEEALRGQVKAARRRLLRELARTLRCISAGDLGAALKNRVQAETSKTDGRYHKALRLLGSYPTWPAEVIEDADAFEKSLSNKDRVARIAGSEIDAAMNDPRWVARNARTV